MNLTQDFPASSLSSRLGAFCLALVCVGVMLTSINTLADVPTSDSLLAVQPKVGTCAVA
jgi:hypothetical protein